MAWTLGNNVSLHNDSTFNDTCCFTAATQEQPAELLVLEIPLTLPRALLLGLFYVVSCSSLFMNALLLRAISEVSTSVLKAKRFIQNSAVGNIVLGGTLAFSPSFVTIIGGNTDTPPHICLLGVYVVAINIGLYIQAICVMGLAADRIFATVRPLLYGTTGYGPTIGRCLVFLPWLLAVSLWSVFIFISWAELPMRNTPGVKFPFCYHLYNSYVKAENINMMDSFLASANLMSFLTYISIFGVIKLRDRQMQTLSTSATKRTNLSLVRTYFLLNLTTLGLYLPAPIYSFVAESAYGEKRTVESTNVSTVLFLVYLTNTSLDPIILISRIRSIRRNLPIVYKPRRKHHGKQTLTSIAGDVQTPQGE